IQSASVSAKLIVDAYGLWTFNPRLALRLTFSNLDPRDYVTRSAVDGPDALNVAVRETATTRAPTYINVQLRLEMKL
ncbi:MAG: TonB-dependent receptor, partial [Rhizobacter sp.]|nr:TonB-dependent receptor [Rhizobacter sp.]